MIKGSEYNKKYREQNPWATHLFGARSRCNNKNHSKYKFYGAKGIKCLLTMKEIRELWFRDCGYVLEQPSIDRFLSSGDYTAGNCRFIELAENSDQSRMKQKKRVGRFDLNGNKLQEYDCIGDATRSFGLSNQNNTSIANCLRGRTKTYKGFIWKHLQGKE